MNKKRRQWRLFGAVAALCMAMLCGGIVAQADGMMGSPNRCMVGSTNMLSIPLSSKSDVIKNIKVYSGGSGTKKTSDIIAGFTGVSPAYNEKGKEDGYEGTIHYYAKKAGTYRIRYDVCKKSGKKNTYTQKVVASKLGTGINLMFDGKKIGDTYIYTTKKSAKLKFTADSGCKIKKITMYYRNSKGKYATKKFKNGSKLTFSIYGGKYDGDDFSAKDIWVATNFEITYTDSYYSSKRTNTAYYCIYSRASKWVKDA